MSFDHDLFGLTWERIIIACIIGEEEPYLYTIVIKFLLEYGIYNYILFKSCEITRDNSFTTYSKSMLHVVVLRGIFGRDHNIWE